MTVQPDTPTAPAINGCTLCGEPARVHWLRRLTPTEISVEQAIEQGRRDAALLLADPQLPAPDFGPLPTCEDYTHTVYGCVHHAIAQDAAALVHLATCTAPDAAHLPGCNCTPENAPEPPPAVPTPPLPPGWS